MKFVLALAALAVFALEGIFCQQALSDCLSQRQANGANPPPGAFVPECEATGVYKAKQCHGSTGLCHCVSATGERLTEPTREVKTCECARRKHENPIRTGPNGEPAVGQFRETCNPAGDFDPVQCNPSTGLCKCVNENGQDTTDWVRGQPQCP